MAPGFTGPVGFGNLGKPGGPTRLGSPPAPRGFRQGGPVGFGSPGHGGHAPPFMRAGGVHPGLPPTVEPTRGIVTHAGGSALSPPQSITAPQPANPAPPQPSGLDSTYYDQLGNATLAANNKINAYNQQSGYAGIDLQNALSQLNYQQGLQTQNTQNAENSRGGFALGHLGQTLGQLNHAYLDRESQDQLAYGRGQAARDAAIAAVRQGLSVEQAALAAAAADRASTNAAKNPALGQSSAPLTPGVSGAPGAPGTEGSTLPPGSKTLTPSGGARQPLSHHPPATEGRRTVLRRIPAGRPGYGIVRGGG